MPAFPSNRLYWNTEFLNSMRHCGDPETDAIAEELFRTGGPAAYRQLRAFCDDWSAPLTQDLPASVREFYQKPVEFPQWVDHDLLRVVENDFVVYGPITTLTVLLGGFTHFFLNPAGARAFYINRLLRPDTIKFRLFQIPQFIINIAQRDGLCQSTGPDGAILKGPGIQSVQKLRLVHSCIRTALRTNQPRPDGDWDFAALGEPLNQEDLMQSILDFCVLTEEGLDKLGVHWTPEQREGTLHFWRVVAFLLGAREELQPASCAEAREIHRIIVDRQVRETMEGKELTRDLVGITANMMPRILSPLPAVLMRYLLGDVPSDMLGVPKHRIISTSLMILKPVWKETRMFAWVAKYIIPKLVAWLINHQPPETSHRFRVPHYLAESWGIQE